MDLKININSQFIEADVAARLNLADFIRHDEYEKEKEGIPPRSVSTGSTIFRIGRFLAVFNISLVDLAISPPWVVRARLLLQLKLNVLSSTA